MRQFSPDFSDAVFLKLFVEVGHVMPNVNWLTFLVDRLVGSQGAIRINLLAKKRLL